MGGPWLAFLTMLVWALPVVTLMTLLLFLSQYFSNMNISQDGLRYIGPMAVGFIVVAAYRIGRKVVKDQKDTGTINCSSCLSRRIHFIINWSYISPWVVEYILVQDFVRIAVVMNQAMNEGEL